MADQHCLAGSSSSDVASENSESTVEVNIKTLDSQIYSFHVDKNILVSVFKEKVATQTGVPVVQQRLIFRGKVLKDDHLLSEYHVEDGNTLHLVVRQPCQQQSPSSINNGEATSNDAGQEPNSGRNRVGQISHSVVLGTFNIGDQGDSVMPPDLSRVIGAVLNSVGIGNQVVGGVSGVTPPGMQQSSQGNTVDGVGVHHSQPGNQSQAGEAFQGQSLPQFLQIPVGAAVHIPSLNTPIPNSLNTLSAFMNLMETSLSDSGLHHDQSGRSGNSQPVDLPTNNHGSSTPEALGIVLRHAQHLLGNYVIGALSHIAGRLEQEGNSTDPTIRGQIQTESLRLGLAMQQLGPLLLELGRTILSLHMGQSPGESSVNPGPAIYISRSGPNPIMVQPMPLQTSFPFGGSSSTPNPVSFNPTGPSNISRHINIHIHTGTPLLPIGITAGSRPANGEAMQEEHANGSGADSGQTRVFSPTNTSTASPSQTISLAQPGVSISSSPGQSENSTIQNHAVGTGSGTVHTHNPPLNNSDGQEIRGSSEALPDSEDLKIKGKFCQPSNENDATASKVQPAADLGGTSKSSPGDNDPNGSTSVPLGLGLGGLQPKRRNKSKVAGDGTSNSSANNRPSTADGQIDPASVMSQVLHGPALDNLLSRVSQQTGVGSPDVLRDTFHKLTQSPAMMNTVNQIAQQIDSQGLGNMFAGLESGQGRGMDLSRMFQQMLPIVSQALSRGGMPVSQPNSASGPVLGEGSSVNEKFTDRDSQRHQIMETQQQSRDIFHSLVQNAAHLSNNEDTDVLVDNLSNDEGLANEFLEMLRADLLQRLQHEKGSGANS